MLLLAGCNVNAPETTDSGLVFTVINDATCQACDPTNVVKTTEQLFPDAKIEYVDINSDEGQNLVEQYSLEMLPSYLFSMEVEQADTFVNQEQIRSVLEKKGDKYQIIDEAAGPEKFIDPAKQAEYEAMLEEQKRLTMEKLGIGDKPQIDFFVMSYCPYGNQAEEAIEPVYQALKDAANFIPRFVVYSNYAGGGPNYCIDEESKYCSMHGVQEMREDIRERCVFENEGSDKGFEFMLAMNDQCNYQNADTCYRGVATGLGIDADAIEQCLTENAEKYAQEDLELNQLLGVSGSPTVFVDGMQYNGERTPAGFQAALCAEFEDAPEACASSLSSTQEAATGSC